MAHIGIENIREVRLNILPVERLFDSKGDLAVHPRVAEMYAQRGYDNEPKTAEEARARGENGFNGLMSSFTRICSYPTKGGNIVSADIAPTRYLIGQALRDLETEDEYVSEAMPQMSPDMANVSLIAPVKIEGAYFLMSQIKGKALGSGEVHAALVAGNINSAYLSAPDSQPDSHDPLIATLRGECSEELGLDLSALDPSSVVYLVDERETGQVNFAYTARQADANLILSAYEQSVKQKLHQGEKLEVMALSELPVAGISLIPLENRGYGLKNVVCYHPAPDGLTRKVEDRFVRPYTVATLNYLREPENVRFLLEQAGF